MRQQLRLFIEKQSIKEQHQRVNAVAVSANEDYVAYATSSAVVLCRLEDVGGEARQQIVELDRANAIACVSLVFRNNLLVCDITTNVLFFDVAVGTLIRHSMLLDYVGVEVRGVAVHGYWLAHGSGNAVRIWSMAATPLEQLHCKTDHVQRVGSVAFSHAGRWLASGSKDGSVVIYTTHDFALHATVTLQDWVVAVCFSPDDSMLAVGAWGGRSAIYSVGTFAFQLLHTLAGDDYTVPCVAWLGYDSSAVVGGTRAGELVAWSASTGNIVHHEKVDMPRDITALSFASSFRSLLLTSGGTTRVFDTSDLYASFATLALYRASLVVFSGLHRSPLGIAVVMQRIAEAVAGDALVLTALSDAERTRIFTASRVSSIYRKLRLPTLEALGNNLARMRWFRNETHRYREGIELRRLGPM